MDKEYDVVILGGGLAGLTLSLQLKKERPEISVLLLERRETEAATAAHKVGESTVELGTHYLREVLGLTSYLEEHELPKHGLRFFFKSNYKEDITTRVELGPRLRLPVPSHQVDRGTLENYLMKLTCEKGSDLILGAKVSGVDISSDNGHEVSFLKDGEAFTVKCKWVADASGRASIMKRKLQFQKPMEHHCNAVWWRLKGVVDIDTWTNDSAWKAYLEPGLRYLSTVHFMDTGYWLWVIPLGSKNTSIGIVADPAVHPFETYNTYEKAMLWMKENEPLAYKMLSPMGSEDGLLDFKILKHYAHHSGKIYSEDRWGVTGESGAFLDPLYSPGTDFIALNNTWLSDLILRDLAGEDFMMRVAIYEQTHLTLLENWIPVYQNKYLLMGNTQIMVIKIFWDWATYWAIPAHLFANQAFTNLRILKNLFVAPNSPGRKFGQLNKIMQDLFLEWQPFDDKIFANRYIDPFDLAVLRKFQQEIEVQRDPSKMVMQIESNLRILEQMAVAIFQLISSAVNGTDPNMSVNPYTIKLGKKENAIQPDTETDNAILPDAGILKDVGTMWFYPKTTALPV